MPGRSTARRSARRCRVSRSVVARETCSVMMSRLSASSAAPTRAAAARGLPGWPQVLGGAAPARVPRPAERAEPGLADGLLRVRDSSRGIRRICAVIDYATKYCLAATLSPTSRAVDALTCLHAAVVEAQRLLGLDDLRADRGVMDVLDPTVSSSARPGAHRRGHSQWRRVQSRRLRRGVHRRRPAATARAYPGPKRADQIGDFILHSSVRPWRDGCAAHFRAGRPIFGRSGVLSWLGGS
jgi:hypothetical protein